MENHLYKVCASSSYLNEAKGAIILIRKALRITIIDKRGDEDGRVAFVKCIYNERKLAFINIYAPNSYDFFFFFAQLNSILAEPSDFELVIDCDMNAIFDHKLDRSSKSAIGSSMLPMAPPPRYWEKIHSIITSFLWRGRQPKIKLTNLQRKKDSGGLSVPNFKLYFHALTIHPFFKLKKKKKLNIEKNLVAPASLNDCLFYRSLCQ